jgi:hypothetical protein
MKYQKMSYYYEPISKADIKLLKKIFPELYQDGRVFDQSKPI